MEIEPPAYSRRRATGFVRALVVASSTLAILLVCFSIYQYSQVDPEAAARLRDRRLPSVAAEEPRERDEDATRDGPSIDIGRGSIGPGEKIQITLYPREGKQARFEISVDDWTPIEGSTNEFLLSKPEVRMRTKNGNAVRVTAERGILEAQRRSGGGLDPQRGRLSGQVVIQYDRLSEADRAILPAELRGRIDPSDLVRIELDEIEFDLEYSKLIVPGRVHLSARDVELEAADLEIRFNDAENRVEQMRIRRGGRIELLEESERLGLSIPAVQGSDERRLTLVEWLRASVQARIDAQERQEQAEQPVPTQAEVTYTDEGVPVFRPKVEGEETTEPPIRYYARFEGEVDAKQLAGDVTLSRLEAGVLEIVRDLSAEEQARVESAPEGGPSGDDKPATPTMERLVLEWADRLVMEVCSPEDARCTGQMRSKLAASGSPVRIVSPEGEATCSKVTFDPDGSKVWLYGTEADPAAVRYADQGTLSGLAIYSERQRDDMYVRVVGPGRLVSESEEGAGPSSPSDAAPSNGLTVEFGEQLEAHGRFVTETSIDLTGTVLSRKQSVLDRASFLGQVRVKQDEMSLGADSIAVTFGTKRSRDADGQMIERLVGRGHVVMTRDADRVTCRELDVSMTVDQDGRTMPRTATALGDVTAQQRERTIEARDKLIVDFEMVERPAPPYDAAKAYAAAVAAGLDVATTDWEARRREHEAKVRREVGVKQLKAFGEVSVVDPIQALDVTADKLDCTIKDGRDIETAFVEGLDDHPASVRLDTLTVAGREIRLNVPDQWAEVPGAGRLTFRSRKDLDGRRLDRPIPIAVTWADWMTYHGRENRSVFSGAVHATSETTTTFDCGRLEVHFQDVAPAEVDAQAAPDWWILQDVVDRLARGSAAARTQPATDRFSKEPTLIVATGNAVALTSEIDPDTDRLKSRARIAGPQLWVDLRPEVSKMQIEGPGNLLLEDYRPARSSEETFHRASRGLFAVSEDAGPSNTLIEWEELMWYDFSIEQTRFEGNVSLKYFSGLELQRIRGRPAGDSSEAMPGRRTFLTCRTLEADFFDRKERSLPHGSRRMGRLSSDRLKQFHAKGGVRLQDQSEGLSLTADRVVYWKDRDVLAVYGWPQRKARIMVQKPGKLPTQVSGERLFYNLSTGYAELVKPELKTR
ncbi:MAG: hypothetical protein JSU86_19030 [Phycisphaerales bacterium]|nr:MAG: hypothetical protein JSU86_19030 [Phycisphaerales bacterium]